MEVANIALRHRGLTQDVPGLRCPVGDEEYILEKEVMTTLKAAESLFEGK